MKKIITFLAFLVTLSQTYTQYNFPTVVSGIRLPTSFLILPNGNFLIDQKEDSAVIYTPNNVFVSKFWNFHDSLVYDSERGLIGVCLDPNYASNHYVYFYFNRQTKGYRVVRFTENNNVGTNPLVIFADSTALSSPSHVAGGIHFGPDNKLYISIGDNNYDTNSQSLHNFKGKILRINSDGSIPTDNPFYDDGNPHTGNDDRIWALGLRNSYDFIFSPFNDSLYATENGPSANDEINFIRKGKNYGWPICQGFCVPYNPLFKQPMDTIWGNTFQDFAPTGIIVYNGSVFPELYGKVIVGSSQTNGPYHGLLACTLGNIPFADTIISQTLIDPISGVSCLKQGTDGYIYMSRVFYNVIVKMMPVTGINNQSVPVSFKLEQNYPNPFNPNTEIKYSLIKNSHVELKIFNTLGEEIATLLNENKPEGSYSVIWNPERFASGVYFYQLTVSGDNLTKEIRTMKMVLIK